MKSILFALFAYGAYGDGYTNSTCNYVDTLPAAVSGYLGAVPIDSCFYMGESKDLGTEISAKFVCDSSMGEGVTYMEYDNTKCDGTATETTYQPTGYYNYNCDAAASCTGTTGIKAECEILGIDVEYTATFLTGFCNAGNYELGCSNGFQTATWYASDDNDCSGTALTPAPTSVTPSPVADTTLSDCELSCTDASSQLMKVYILAFAVIISLFY
jgi:hypothetical protein